MQIRGEHGILNEFIPILTDVGYVRFFVTPKL